jgi:PhnB protein
MARPAVKPIPDGMHSLTPYLVCAGAAEAIEFYKKAFDAVAEMLEPTGDSRRDGRDGQRAGMIGRTGPRS